MACARLCGIPAGISQTSCLSNAQQIVLATLKGYLMLLRILAILNAALEQYINSALVASWAKVCIFPRGRKDLDARVQAERGSVSDQTQVSNEHQQYHQVF
jgi:hypothetical protein